MDSHRRHRKIAASKPSRRGSGRSFRSALQGVAPPGNDNTAANSRVAVLSGVAALPQDRQHHHLCRGGGVERGGGLAPRPPSPATSVVAAVLIRRLPGSLARGAFQMIVFGHAARAPRPRDENSSGRAVPDSWTIGGKTPARQRFGRPQGVDGCGRLPRPAKTATSTVAAVFESPRILARAWFRRRVGSGVGSPKRPQELEWKKLSNHKLRGGGPPSGNK